jgi:tetratricopeptide (TPR) repeat protein
MALRLLERALAVSEKVLGPEHLFVGKLLSNLAEVQWHQGKYAEAEHLYERSLAILEGILGAEHQDVAVDVTGLATVKFSRHKYAEAESLNGRAITILEKQTGLPSPRLVEAWRTWE